MSELPGNHGLEPETLSDEALLAAHEQLDDARQPDDQAHYRLLPILMLFAFSGLILFAGTYLNRYAGHYSVSIFDENAKVGGEAAPVKVDMAALGKKQFDSACITCHQATGTGVPGVYPPLAGSEWVNGTEDRVIRIVLYGLKGPVTVEGHPFGNAAMPVFGQVAGSGYNWSDQKIAAVLTYVRQSWGNKGAPVETDTVTKIRQATGDRKEWSEAELQAIK